MKEVSSEAIVWYDNMVVGERSLGDILRRISKEANLSRIHTNHSIRVTTVTILDKSGFEARHVMTVSGHRNESSTRADSKTDQTTNRRMWETLTAAGAGNSAPDEDSVRLENLTAENINLSPLLTLSQEEHVMRHLHFQTIHSQVSKNFAFYNCNVFFFQLRLNIYWYFLSQPAFIQFFTYCLMLRFFVNRIMCRWFVNFYTSRNKLSVPNTVVTIFFVQCIIKQLSVWVISLSLRLRYITPTSTLIILNITKTSSNNCLQLPLLCPWNILRGTSKNNSSVYF